MRCVCPLENRWGFALFFDASLQTFAIAILALVISTMDIPEIIIHVGRFLDHNSLASAVRVSKTWHQLLIPLLYHSPRGNRSMPSEAALARHAHHIRRLSLFLGINEESDDDPVLYAGCRSVQCRNLVVLDLFYTLTKTMTTFTAPAWSP